MDEKGGTSEGYLKRKHLLLSLKHRQEQNGPSPKIQFAQTSEEEMESLKMKPMSKNTKQILSTFTKASGLISLCFHF